MKICLQVNPLNNSHYSQIVICLYWNALVSLLWVNKNTSQNKQEHEWQRKLQSVRKFVQAHKLK